MYPYIDDYAGKSQRKCKFPCTFMSSDLLQRFIHVRASEIGKVCLLLANDISLFSYLEERRCKEREKRSTN